MIYILGFVEGDFLLSAMGFIPIKAPFGGNISGTFSQIPTSKSKVSLREVFGVYIQTNIPHNLTLLSMGSMEPFGLESTGSKCRLPFDVCVRTFLGIVFGSSSLGATPVWVPYIVPLQGGTNSPSLRVSLAPRLEGAGRWWLINIKDDFTFTSKLVEHTPPIKTNMSPKKKGPLQQGR